MTFKLPTTPVSFRRHSVAVVMMSLVLTGFSSIPAGWAFSLSTTTKTDTNSQRARHVVSPLSMISSLPTNINKVGIASDDFLKEYFHSDIDDFNVPPSLSILRRSLAQLCSGSDIRGQFVPTPASAKGARSMSALAHAMGQTTLPPLTPFSAHCLGYAFATMVLEQREQVTGGHRSNINSKNDDDETITICIGRDPREHGVVLADAFARGAAEVPNVKVVYTGIATTPALFEFCRSSLCDGGVMVTASHLPGDRNGFKFFSKHAGGGFNKAQIHQMIGIAQEHSQVWFDRGALPSTSGTNGVFCSEVVNWMPIYEEKLQQALWKQVNSNENVDHTLPLEGLKIVLNAGNGSGGFFRQVLEDLGANVDGSLHTTPDSSFPNGIPNPEYDEMIQETVSACEDAHADLGILLDTDADRCGMVAPRTYQRLENGTIRPTGYEPLNRNRLIALMGVIYSQQSPGCAIVTDSVTSTGLSKFLEQDLGLKHVRFLRGYANVISKAQTLNEQHLMNAEVAIETSGHCAVKENGFLDDGTFTAVKVLGLLAQERRKASHEESTSSSPVPPKSLLDLISSLQELDEVMEFRLEVLDGGLESMIGLFDFVALEIDALCEVQKGWKVDHDNLEGIRVETDPDGGFFLLRKSLHDPVMCLQVEANSRESAKQSVIDPLLGLFQSQPRIAQTLDLSALELYSLGKN